MPTVRKNEVEYDHYFDQKSNRHYLNGVLTVLHCHHYTSLYTQLAIDAGETELLKECAREVFRDVLADYFRRHPAIADLQSKVEIACQYYAMIGLGSMRVVFMGDESGEVRLDSSHTDSGWIKKWGKSDKPINYLTAGYIEAMFEVLLDAPAKSFHALEVESIAMGSPSSRFKVVRR